MITTNCKNCEKVFSHTGSNKGLFCTFVCYNSWRLKKGVSTKCVQCGDVIKTSFSAVKDGRSKFCSKTCVSKNRRRLPKECKYCKKEFILKKKTYGKNTGIFCSKECMYTSRRGVPHSRKTNNGMPAWNRGLKLPQWSGENHPRWIKDRSKVDEKHQMRGSFEWKEWRTAVFKRDNYQCKDCGIIGGYMEPHHIVPLRVDLTAAYKITNGITLCRACHKKTMWKEDLFKDKYLDIIAKM